MDAVIKAPLVVAHIGALGLHRFASEFLWAADSFRSQDKGFSPVPYYLYCRSIELALKSFLLARGVKRVDLRRVGHDLMQALSKAQTLDIDSLVEITVPESEQLKRANDLYKKKDFEYFENAGIAFGLVSLPDLKVLSDLASRLLIGIEKIALRAVNGPLGPDGTSTQKVT